MTQPPQPPEWNQGQSAPPWGNDPKAAAKAEKAYRKAQRPFYKKKRVLIPAAFLALIGFSAAAGGGDDGGGSDTVATDSGSGDTAEAPADKPAAKPAEKPKPEYAGATDDDTAVQAGQPIELSDWTATATPLTPTTSDLQQQVLCSNVTLVNNDDEQQEYSSLSWKLQFPNGSVNDMTFTGDNDLGNVGGSGLAPGGTVTQKACFEDIQAGPGQYILAWQPDVFSSKDRGVWLNTL